MRWPELRLTRARLEAERAMRAELEQAERDAALLPVLARRRCTVRPSRWLASEREAWARHEALRRSLRALAHETLASEAPVQHVGRAIDCPACALAVGRR